MIRESRPSAASTASPEEIARFAGLADAWWDPDGEFKPLHRLNPTRLAYIRDSVAGHFGRDPLADRPLDGLALIDIGCGGGLLSEPMARLGARVTGIDAGEKSINVARIHAEQSGLAIDYRHAVPEDFAASADQSYDVVLAMDVVEHVADLDAFLAAAAGLLRPGGAMVISTVNRTLKSLAFAKVAAEYLLRWLPVGTHDWRKFVRPSQLADGLNAGGVTIADLRGMIYNPLTDRWSYGSDLAVNYLAFGVRA